MPARTKHQIATRAKGSAGLVISESPGNVRSAGARDGPLVSAYSALGVGPGKANRHPRCRFVGAVLPSKGMDAADDLTSVPARPPARGPAEPLSEQESAATVLSGGSTAPPPPTSISELGSLLEGRRLGDYRLDEFVGGGGMGAVFKALDTTLDRIVAVKVLAGHQSADEEMLRRFRNEAQSAARLNHENIGLVHAVGSSDGWHFIVFEYIEGTNLRDLVRQRGPLSVAAAVDVSLQIAAALDHAGRRNVTHRDIKPSNIIITPAGRAKLVDMGLARLQQVAGEQDLTVSGMTLGTFDYISPEQARDARAADIRSDLYSLGCTMFFMLIGRAPFAEGTMVQKLLQHQQEAPPAVEMLRTDVPRRLAAVIRRLMAKQPEERFAQPADLEAELVAIAEEEGIDLTVGRPMLEAAPASRRGVRGSLWPWLGAAVCLAALVTALAIPTEEAIMPEGPSRNTARVQDAGPTNTPIRMAATLGTDPDGAGITEVLAAAEDEAVIELAADREYLIGPIDLGGKTLTIRAAAGQRPLLRIDDNQFAPTDDQPVAWRIGGGQLTLEGIDIRLDGRADSVTSRRSIFQIGPGGGLICRNVGFAVTAASGGQDNANEPTPRDRIITLLAASLEESAAEVTEAGEQQQNEVSSIPVRVEMTDVVVNGEATVCGVEGATGLSLTWRGGGATVIGRFLDVGGSPSSVGPLIGLRLDTATFACQEGFIRLADAPTQIRVPRLEAVVERCRLLIPEPAALIEQIGVAEPEAYQTAVNWLDRLGRYEGSRIFRRIDGAGDTVEIDFAAAPRPLAHQPFFNSWPAGVPVAE